MKAQELMIGDWVRGFVPDSNSTIYGFFNERRVAIIAEPSKAYIELSIDDIQPIPLTPEILEKNGFVRRDDLIEDSFLPFILERNDDGGLYEIVIEWREDYDNGATDAFNVESWDECWKLHISNGMNTYKSTTSVIFVHELQRALRCCGINELANKFKV